MKIAHANFKSSLAERRNVPRNTGFQTCAARRRLHHDRNRHRVGSDCFRLGRHYRRSARRPQRPARESSGYHHRSGRAIFPGSHSPRQPHQRPCTSASLDFLTNYVESIAVTTLIGSNQTTVIYTNNNILVRPVTDLTNGATILSLLSTPEYHPLYPNNVSKSVTARIRGLTGAATEQNGSNAVTAFRYFMNVEVVPFNSISPQSTDFADFNSTNDPVDYNPQSKCRCGAPLTSPTISTSFASSLAGRSSPTAKRDKAARLIAAWFPRRCYI